MTFVQQIFQPMKISSLYVGPKLLILYSMSSRIKLEDSMISCGKWRENITLHPTRICQEAKVFKTN